MPCIYLLGSFDCPLFSFFFLCQAQRLRPRLALPHLTPPSSPYSVVNVAFPAVTLFIYI